MQFVGHSQTAGDKKSVARHALVFLVSLICLLDEGPAFADGGLFISGSMNIALLDCAATRFNEIVFGGEVNISTTSPDGRVTVKCDRVTFLPNTTLNVSANFLLIIDDTLSGEAHIVANASIEASQPPRVMASPSSFKHAARQGRHGRAGVNLGDHRAHETKRAVSSFTAGATGGPGQKGNAGVPGTVGHNGNDAYDVVVLINNVTKDAALTIDTLGSNGGAGGAGGPGQTGGAGGNGGNGADGRAALPWRMGEPGGNAGVGGGGGAGGKGGPGGRGGNGGRGGHIAVCMNEQAHMSPIIRLSSGGGEAGSGGQGGQAGRGGKGGRQGLPGHGGARFIWWPKAADGISATPGVSGRAGSDGKAGSVGNIGELGIAFWSRVPAEMLLTAESCNAEALIIGNLIGQTPSH